MHGNAKPVDRLLHVACCTLKFQVSEFFWRTHVSDPECSVVGAAMESDTEVASDSCPACDTPEFSTSGQSPRQNAHTLESSTSCSRECAAQRHTHGGSVVAEHRYRSARCAAHLPPGPPCMRTTLPDLLPGVLDSCPSFWPVVPTEDLGRDRPERRDAHWLIVTTSDSRVGVHVQASLPGLQDHQQLLF